MNLVLQAWLAAVVFIYPIPHTVALRNLLLFIGVLVLFIKRKPGIQIGSFADLRPAGSALAVTTTWLLLHSVTLADQPFEAIANLRGDWFVPICTGLLAMLISSRIEQSAAIRAIVLAMAAHLTWLLCWQLWVFTTTVAWPDRGTISVPFGNIDHHSTVAMFLVALVLSERLAVFVAGIQAQLLSSRLAWSTLTLALVSDLALRARNGTAVIVALMVVAALYATWRRRKFIIFLLAVLSFAAMAISMDKRWTGFKESFTVAWSSDSTYWLNWDPVSAPVTSTGAPLEHSVYARTSWARQGLLAIEARPMGSGFGRDGFGRFVEEKYGKSGLVSSHSGLIDFTIGSGIPGLALLLATSMLAIWSGVNRFRLHGDTTGLAIAFLVSAYALRCLLDGHLSGWRLSLFAFILGPLLALRMCKVTR